MSEIICVDDRFSPEAREVYDKYGITTPYEGNVYTVRDIVVSRIGTGLLLHELINPMVPVGEGENGFKVEVNFKISRFQTIDGRTLTEELLRMIEPKSTRKDLV